MILPALIRLVLALWAVGTGLAVAQKPFRISVGDGEVRGDYQATAGSMLPGGYGYVVVRLSNRDRDLRSVRTSIGTEWWSSLRFSCSRSLALEPGETARLVMPLPATPNPHYRLEVSVDGGRSEVAEHLSADDDSEPGILCLGSNQEVTNQWHPWIKRLVADITPAAGGAQPRLGKYVVRDVTGMPDRWQWLTSFDLILVDGGSDGLDSAAQKLLVDYAAAGGQVVVADVAALPEGDLRRRLEPDLEQIERHGYAERTWRFGWLYGLASNQTDAASATPLPDRLQGLVKHARAQSFRTPHRVVDDLSSVQQPVNQQISPVVFFLVILLFAIIAGPINLFAARRAKKPLQVLFTLPVLGIGTTLLVLGYGIFSEGFGTKGNVGSITFLDQDDHEATSYAVSALYAGLSPSALTATTGTSLASPMMHAGRDSPASLDFDLDRGSLGGGALPARTPMTWLTLSQGPCRERLRFARRDDGRLDLLASPTLTPRDAAGSLLLRDPAGGYWRKDKDQVLTKVRDDQVDDAVRAVLATRLPANEAKRSHQPSVGNLDAWLRDQLEPGTWIASLDHDPTVGLFGLEVKWLDARHLMIGRLGQEDFVD